MAAPVLRHRDRATLPLLGAAGPSGPVLLDTNVFINALTGRGPEVLKTLLANLPQSFVSAPTFAELSWTKGRLDPDHPGTAKIVMSIEQTIAQIDAGKILTPTADHWKLAGELAGAAVRAVAGEVRTFKNAADRHEMLNDALTAIVAADAGVTVITHDGDFDLFMQLNPALNVLFYEKA